MINELWADGGVQQVCKLVYQQKWQIKVQAQVARVEQQEQIMANWIVNL